MLSKIETLWVAIDDSINCISNITLFVTSEMKQMTLNLSIYFVSEIKFVRGDIAQFKIQEPPPVSYNFKQ